ncbi:cation diffusion facilitator family transporter [Corynebacterium gerontici]|uniref:Cadmium, cobalt and zinc/H(+)-K(+) antiporter n=1 Tax=Corynebacterium gerontici TaxID=2079234 RepID=A0A3G6J2U0_9CORY|nr:cation diffusion facilitator family transporter [Corynebacterium gerontici]AZA11288.1 Cadmium, cobalt and zinc/H(+)-K(+) antiporter [Corynebacterium gerontici]
MHTHEHHGGAKSLSLALGVTATIFFVELIGGALAGSLALMSDAMHMLSDSTGLVVALVATLIARRAADAKSTYGYKRLEVFAAMLNAATVVGVSIWIVLEAFHRLGDGIQVDAGTTLIIGVIGLVANVLSASVLHRDKDQNLNVEGAYLHVLVDLFGSIAVIVSSALMMLGWMWADTVASLMIAALIFPRAVQLLMKSMNVLMERVPSDVDLASIEQRMLEIRGVEAIHDLHVWSLDGNEALATCHVVVEKHMGDCGILDSVQAALKEQGVGHSTIQIELSQHRSHEDVCQPR